MASRDASESRAFLVLHGYDNFRPAGHWQHHLAAELGERGERVVYPQLPDADAPQVDAWADAVARALAEASDDGRRRVIVVCHSLACIVWLAARPAEDSVERVLLVAPPEQDVLAGIDALTAFAALPLTTPSTPTLLVGSDNDPYSPNGVSASFGEPLGIPVTVIPNGGHLEPGAGYGRWPSLLEWCLDATTAIGPNRGARG
jgi:predicted alpha/beta hydrolase family esterase